MERRDELRVVHVLEALNTGSGLWGKERVVESLMIAQRASGTVAPSAMTFTPSRLGDRLRHLDFEVDVLEEQHRRLPIRALPALSRALRRRAPAIVHTHGYKANVIARAARVYGAPMQALTATCHAWFDETFFTRAYNVLDRRTAFISDMVTVADRGMLTAFPPGARVEYVANGLPDRTPASGIERAESRARFGFPQDVFVAGFLARTNVAKGAIDVLEAARLTQGEPILWAVAGTGECDAQLADARLQNLRFLGYVAESEKFRRAIDAYVQASHVEGLSLSLLEAMRAGLPIVATRAGSTELAVRDGIEAQLVDPGDVEAIARAVRRFARDRGLASELGNAARRRFRVDFQIERQHEAFFNVYERAIRHARAHGTT